MAVDRALEPAVQADPLTSTRDAKEPKRDGLADLEATLGYAFAKRETLVLALTHVGAATHRTRSYQRLEFLGDRILGLAIAGMLYRAYPDADEGELSRRLADLVRKESCASVATDWSLEAHIRLNAGERASVALRRAILGDICEAVIGAVFLDGGFAAADALVQRAFEARMRAPRHAPRDSKTTLQEWAQGQGLPVPLYRAVARTGPDHAPDFTVAVVVGTFAEADGSGPSKRAAEHAAASAFLSREGIGEGDTP